jgi:hypothetical protein
VRQLTVMSEEVCPNYFLRIFRHFHTSNTLDF